MPEKNSLTPVNPGAFGVTIDQKSILLHIIYNDYIVPFNFMLSKELYGTIFSFPPGSKPHESIWTYQGQRISWDPFGKTGTEKCKRKIEIYIKNKDYDNVLRANLDLNCASVRGKIHWVKFEELTIELFEEGNTFATDEYNKWLLKEGPKLLLTLNYIWNENKFIKASPNKSMNQKG